MRKGEEAIMNLFLWENKELSFTEIKNGTGLSPPSLSENLSRLTTRGFLVKTSNRKYRIPKGNLPFLNTTFSIEKNLLQVINASTALFWRSLGSKQGIMSLNIENKDDIINRRTNHIQKGIVAYNSLILYSIWKMLTYVHKNENTDKIREYLEDYFIPMIYIIKNYIKNNEDIIEVFNDNMLSLEKNAKEWLFEPT